MDLYRLKTKQEYYDKYHDTLPEFQPDGRRTEDELARHIKAAMADGKTTFNFWYKQPHGDVFPVNVTLVKAFYENEDHVLEFTKDMSETYEMEIREHAIKERMQVILDTAPIVCAMFDENSIPVDVNREVEHMFNVPDKQMFLDDIERFFPKYQPDGSPSMEKAAEVARTALAKGSYRHEWSYQQLDGTPVPVEEIFQKVTVEGKELLVAYIRDLREEHKKREEEKRAQRRMHEKMDRLNGHLETQSSAITESSAAIEEMIANIRSVSNTLMKNAESVKGLQEASVVGHSGLIEVITDIREIAHESESLLGINSVMSNIASQTNLLSMNAAIEAAHAGQSGRGFAVVADEIRKLAESSSKQSKTIGAVLKKIKSSIDKITKSTDSVIGKFTAIEDGVNTVAIQEEGIFNAMTEQGAGSSQIMQAVAQVNDITYQVKTDAREIVEAAAKLGI